MALRVLLLFGLTFAVAAGHYNANPSSWQNTQLLGGCLNCPMTANKTPLSGELSFLTWLFHWTMIIDYLNLLRCMWRWGDFTNDKWKLYTLLHLPACLVNCIVVINHLHRDKIVVLSLLHPVLVFVGSIATCYGSYAIARTNGWGTEEGRVDRLENVVAGPKDNLHRLIKGSNLIHTIASFAIGSLLAYCSVCLTV